MTAPGGGAEAEKRAGIASQVLPAECLSVTVPQPGFFVYPFCRVYPLLVTVLFIWELSASKFVTLSDSPLEGGEEEGGLRLRSCRDDGKSAEPAP